MVAGEFEVWVYVKKSKPIIEELLFLVEGVPATFFKPFTISPGRVLDVTNVSRMVENSFVDPLSDI